MISELYALPLADFTRVRNDLAAQAKARGRKQLAESIKGAYTVDADVRKYLVDLLHTDYQVELD